MADVAESIAVNADAERVWALVSDVTRMGEWSPETTACRWTGGATGPVVGARFRGANRAGWRRWSTLSTVTDARPGERFAFRVTFGPLQIADWAYDFVPDGPGTRVTESWTDRRPAWMLPFYGPLMGVADRGEHNRAGMLATLAAIKQAAERG